MCVIRFDHDIGIDIVAQIIAIAVVIVLFACVFVCVWQFFVECRPCILRFDEPLRLCEAYTNRFNPNKRKKCVYINSISIDDESKPIIYIRILVLLG